MRFEPGLRQSLCAFIDILGFSAKVLDAYRHNEEEAVFQNVFGALSETAERIATADKNLPMVSVKMFTDNIVIVWEDIVQGQCRDLVCLCELVADYQLSMARLGYFIRGGISSGSIAVSDQVVFGDALIKAVGLESMVACNPRVIVDPDLARTCQAQLKTLDGNWKSTWRMRVMKDVDGHYFVNYLSEAVRRDSAPGRFLEVDEEILAKHRDRIESNLESTISDPRVWSKYFWAANYHNAFCDQKARPRVKIDLSRMHPQPVEAD